MVGALGIVALLGGCGPEETRRSPSGGAATNSPIPDEDGELTFPVQDPAYGGMDALLNGQLVKRSECLYVLGTDGTHKILPIWPHGYSYETNGDDVTVLDGEGSAVLETGDRVSMGGGLIGEEESPLPPEMTERVGDCDGPYWLVSEV